MIKPKYKPGDKVRIIPRLLATTQRHVGPCFCEFMYKYCDNIYTIRSVFEDNFEYRYRLLEIPCTWIEPWFVPVYSFIDD